jgi:hypothetical protein
MRIAMLSPIAWRTPPRHYGPWESVTSLLTEGLVARGHDVTLFATEDSQTSGKLHAVCPRGYEEDPVLIPKVWECLHISELFEHADAYDMIHNHFDFLPLTYSGMTTTPVVTTIHGFSSPRILPVYKKYNGKTFYVSISDADRSPDLDYIKTIHHGLDIRQFDFQPAPDDTLLFSVAFTRTKVPGRLLKSPEAAAKNWYWQASSRIRPTTIDTSPLISTTTRWFISAVSDPLNAIGCSARLWHCCTRYSLKNLSVSPLSNLWPAAHP